MKNTNFKIIKTLMVFAIINLFSACSKDELISDNNTTAKFDNTLSKPGPPPPTGKASVYAVMNSPIGTQQLYSRAKLEVNGLITNLSTLPSDALSVTVSDAGDVYVGGWEGSLLSGKVWKNGQSYQQTNAIGPVNCVTAYNSDIYYIAGNQIYKNNDLIYSLTSNLNGTIMGKSLTIYGSDVYSCGIIGCLGIGVWKNDVLINFFPQASLNSSEMNANQIYVDNTGVFVAGKINNLGCVWKNASRFDFSNSYEAYSVVSLWGYLYIGGSVGTASGTNYGRLWKMNQFTNSIVIDKIYDRTPFSSFVYGNSVYSGSWEKIYIDNTTLSFSTIPNIAYRSICVK
jgi:hypothetical protein